MAQIEERKLKKGLSIWQVVGLSVALMAPSMAANINPQGAASAAGRAVPLAFAFAAVGVMFVAYVFVRLTQYFNHSGSVFGFVGATIGPRAGILAGWSLMGTYLSYALVTVLASSIFATSLLKSIGVWNNPPFWAPFVLAAFELVLVWYLAISPAKNSTKILLTVEGATVSLIILITIIVLVKLIGGHGPQGQHFTMSVFSTSKGTTTSSLFLGVVFGFLSFAGFEASATLGEEAKRPRKDIPRAILGTAIFGGVYFIVVTAVEMMGFGTSNKEVAAFIASGSLLGDLGKIYVASWVGNLITVGTIISAFGCALASTVGSARLMYAINRDGVGIPRLTRLSEKHDTPVPATTTVVVGVALIGLLCAAAFGAKPFDEFVWFGTIGTLILLVVYLLATLGTIHLLFISGKVKIPKWEIILPIIAAAILAYTLYRNVSPYPTGVLAWLPVASGAWILVAIVAVVVRPRIAKRAGEMLTRNEGLLPVESAYDLEHTVESINN